MISGYVCNSTPEDFQMRHKKGLGYRSKNTSGLQLLQAPSVHLVGSTYYLYYAVSVFGSQSSAIGYATSTTMEVGSWTDHGATGIASTSSKPYNAIDPDLVQATDGSYYMSFGSFWGDSKPPPNGLAPSELPSLIY